MMLFIPRKARIDAPGALHYIIARGIARRKVFDDNDDQERDFSRNGVTIKAVPAWKWMLERGGN